MTVDLLGWVLAAIFYVLGAVWMPVFTKGRGTRYWGKKGESFFDRCVWPIFFFVFWPLGLFAALYYVSKGK